MTLARELIKDEVGDPLYNISLGVSNIDNFFNKIVETLQKKQNTSMRRKKSSSSWKKNENYRLTTSHRK